MTLRKPPISVTHYPQRNSLLVRVSDGEENQSSIPDLPFHAQNYQNSFPDFMIVAQGSFSTNIISNSYSPDFQLVTLSP